MKVVIFVIVIVLAIILGICLGFFIARKTLKLSALGTVMVENEEHPENMYMVWNEELEDILKYEIGLVRIKKFNSPN